MSYSHSALSNQSDNEYEEDQVSSDASGRIMVADEHNNDLSLQPMAVLDSGGGGGGGGGSNNNQSSFEYFINHRASSFVFGIAFTVCIAALASVLQSMAHPPQTPENSLWTVEINLDQNEVLLFQSRVHKNNRIQDHQGEVSYSINDAEVDYDIEKLCGNKEWSYMRFQVTNCTITNENPNFLTKLTDHVPNHLSTGPSASSSPSSPSASSSASASASASSSASSNATAVVNPHLEQRFSKELANTMVGHTFTAKLAHDGRVLKRDSSNIVSTLHHALKSYVIAAFKVLSETYLQMNLSPKQAENVLINMQRNLEIMGRFQAEEIQEFVYPFLQTSPTDKRKVMIGESWTRTTSEDLIKLNLTYTLEEYRSSNQGRTAPPFIIDAFTVFPANPNGNSDYGDHISDKKHEQDENDSSSHDSSSDKITNKITNHNNEYEGPIPKKQESGWLIVKVDGDTAISDPHLLQEYAHSVFPTPLIGRLIFVDVSLIVFWRGKFVVGADSGVTLDGIEIMEYTCNATFHVHTPVVNPPHPPQHGSNMNHKSTLSSSSSSSSSPTSYDFSQLHPHVSSALTEVTTHVVEQANKLSRQQTLQQQKTEDRISSIDHQQGAHYARDAKEEVEEQHHKTNIRDGSDHLSSKGRTFHTESQKRPNQRTSYQEYTVTLSSHSRRNVRGTIYQREE